MGDVNNPGLHKRFMSHRLLALAAPVCLSLVVGCGGGHSQVETAQIAVRANPNLELVATDEKQGVLTVRVKQTGRVMTVSAADVTAGTAFRDLDTASASNTAASSTDSSTAQQQREGTGVDVTSRGNGVSVRQTPGGVSVDRQSGGRVGSGVAVTQGASGVSVDATRERGGRAAQRPGQQVGVATRPGGVNVSDGTSAVSVESTGGQLSVRTPQGNVAIGGTAAPSASARQGGGSRAESQSGGQEGANIDDSRLKRQSRMVVCSGDKDMRLDGVLLRAEEAAVQVVGNCTITIANSHIIGETGVQVAENGDVKVENSIIEGSTAAFQLSGSADASVHQSTIRGGVQRVQNAKLRDLGNNRWR